MPTPTPQMSEINSQALKLLVGIVAVILGNLTVWLSATALESISASYYEDGATRDFFVGLLFTIGAFLSAYNGITTLEKVLAKFAALASVCIAIFPCSCDPHQPRVPHVHYIAAAVMFLVLAVYCLIFYARARKKKTAHASRRCVLYAACGAAISFAIAVMAFDAATGGSISATVPRLTFYGERTGLIAFGISWIVSGKLIPWIATSEERAALFSSPVHG